MRFLKKFKLCEFSPKKIPENFFYNHSFNKYLSSKYAPGSTLYFKLQNTQQSVDYLVCVF